MACNRFEYELALYVENDLPIGDRERLEAHLSECAECRTVLAQLRDSQAALRSLANLAISDELFESVRAGAADRIRRETPKPKARFGLYRAMVVAAAAMVVFAISGLLVYRNGLQSGAPAEGRLAQRPMESGVRTDVGLTPEPAAQQESIKTLSASSSETSEESPNDPPALSQREPDMVVHLITDDPNVVIILVSNHEELDHVQTQSS